MMQNLVRSFTAASLEEYLSLVSFINEDNRIKLQNKLDVQAKVGGGTSGGNQVGTDVRSTEVERARDINYLWFRGVKHQNYNLIPTLFREKEDVEGPYSILRLNEDYRYQHFRAKCNQLIERTPESRIEWMEVMQHYCANTRLMDWSESAITALLFALEYFIQPGNDKGLQYNRATSTPTVWVTNPFELNSRLYDAFLKNQELIEKGIEDIIPVGINKKERQNFTQKVVDDIVSGKNRFWGVQNKRFIQGIVCLSVLESERQAAANRIYYMIKNNELNPFFYLLLRYYNDGLPINMKALPPLAIVHPYHSPRIKAQKGVFTVSPYYLIGKDKVNGSDDYRPMEYQSDIADCLYKIRILRPNAVAKELLLIGERKSSIYPEMENYASDLEAMEYMV